jgi:hypothetical protein
MHSTTSRQVQQRRNLSRPPSLALALAVAAALASMAPGPARADSAWGVDTALGNVLNPPGRSNVPRPLAVDADDAVRRSPTGQLFGIPPEHADLRRETADGWAYRIDLSVGLLGGNAGQKNALFRKYKDTRNGLTLDHVEAEADKADSAHFVQFVGGGLGQSDQFFGLQFGRYNDWKVKLFYTETRHVFTDTYKSIFDGSGTGNLTLAGGLKPIGGATPVVSGAPSVGTGTCTAAAPCWRYTGPDGVSKVYSGATALAGINWTGGATVAAGTPVSPNSIAGALNKQLAATEDTELGLVRKKLGSVAEMRLDEHWKAIVQISQERRNGTRPFNVNENNYTAEIPEPIDYRTTDLLAALSYSDGLTQANLRATGSLFSNQIETLTVQQPWLAAATGLAAAQTTRFSLYPDNKAFNVKGEFAQGLPSFYKARFTAHLALGTTRQDAPLQLPLDPAQSAQIAAAMGTSVLAGINNPGYALNTLDLRNWDGTNGSPLSRSTAGQRIDSRLLNIGLQLQPLDTLNLRADLRDYSTHNQGGYLAYNPLTGQFGRGFRNSSAFDLVVGSAGTPGAIGTACHTPEGYTPVAACRFNGNLGVTGQSTNNPANVPVLSPPREIRQGNAVIAADYTLARGRTLNAQVEREEFHRSFREREKTWDDKFKVGYVDRSFEEGTVRLSYEGGRRRGSHYEFWPVEDMGTGLPGLGWDTVITQYLKTAAMAPGWTVAPANLAGYLARYAYDSRKFDQADRDHGVFNARLNLALRDDVDLAVAVQQRDATYPNSGYGLQNDRATSVNVETNWQPNAEQQLSAYYSGQDGQRSMRANAGTNAAAANNACTFPVGTVLSVEQVILQCNQQVWLSASTWTLDERDRTRLVGVALQTALGPLRLSLDASRMIGRTATRYGYGANVLTAAQASTAGSGFPDTLMVQNSLSAQLLVPVQKAVAVRLLYRYESTTVRDWHYDTSPVGASAAENQATLLLDAGPQSYRNHLFGVMLQFKL